MNETLHPLFQDFVLEDYHRRVEESLRIYELFKRDEPDTDEEPSGRLAGRWFGVGGALSLVWSVCFAINLNKA